MLPRALPSLPLGEGDEEEEEEDEEKRKRWGCIQWDGSNKKKHMWTKEGRKLLLKAALRGGILLDFYQRRDC